MTAKQRGSTSHATDLEVGALEENWLQQVACVTHGPLPRLGDVRILYPRRIRNQRRAAVVGKEQMRASLVRCSPGK